MLLSRTDEISKTTPVTSIGPSDYQNAYDLEKFFTTQLQSSGSFKEKKITFEVDNGWFDVDGSDPSATYQHMSGSVSPYASRSPYAMGADGRTTGVVGSFNGVHNPNANAEGTVRFLDVGSDFKVDFSLSQIGHYGGPESICGPSRRSSVDREDVNCARESCSVCLPDHVTRSQLIPGTKRLAASADKANRQA